MRRNELITVAAGEAVYPRSCFHASAYVTYYTTRAYGIHITNEAAGIFYTRFFPSKVENWLAFTYQKATKSRPLPKAFSERRSERQVRADASGSSLITTRNRRHQPQANTRRHIVVHRGVQVQLPSD